MQMERFYITINAINACCDCCFSLYNFVNSITSYSIICWSIFFDFFRVFSRGASVEHRLNLSGFLNSLLRCRLSLVAFFVAQIGSKSIRVCVYLSLPVVIFFFEFYSRQSHAHIFYCPTFNIYSAK